MGKLYGTTCSNIRKMKRSNPISIFLSPISSFAFTLAEVLIVIGIIGIVAEMTIPTLVQSYQEKEMAVSLQKFNSTLQQAVMMWKNDLDCHEDSFTCITQQPIIDNDPTAFDQIAKYMRVSKSTTTPSTADWLPSDTLTYYGTTSTSGYGKVAQVGSNVVVYLLQDGTTFSVDYSPGGYAIYVDVNGKKRPNRYGKDTFPITVGFLPGKDIYYDAYYGYPTTNTLGLCTMGLGCDPNNVNPLVGNGASPTGYVLTKGKLPDFLQLSKSIAGFAS